MESAIVVSKSKKTATIITEILRDEFGCEKVSAVSSAEKAHNICSENRFELAVVCTPLEGEFGTELISELSKSGKTPVVIVASADEAEEIQKEISSSKAFVIYRPVTKIMLIQVIHYVSVMRTEMLKLHETADELENRLAETKIIDRAKFVLIQYLRISEEQAHRQIQKQAMDKRVKPVDVARDILKTYEN